MIKTFLLKIHDTYFFASHAHNKMVSSQEYYFRKFIGIFNAIKS